MGWRSYNLIKNFAFWIHLINRLNKLCSFEIRDKSRRRRNRNRHNVKMSHTNIRIEPMRLKNIRLGTQAIGRVNEYPTMHYFGILRQWQHKKFWLSISGNSSEYLHCGNVVNMPHMRYSGYHNRHTIKSHPVGIVWSTCSRVMHVLSDFQCWFGCSTWDFPHKNRRQFFVIVLIYILDGYQQAS